MQDQDPIFAAEQAHLSELYAKLLKIRDDISQDLESNHKGAKQDLIEMSEEVRLDFGGADETIETLAAIETLNSIIDAYNQYHDFNVDKLRRVMLLLMQPYFAKVTLEDAPGPAAARRLHRRRRHHRRAQPAAGGGLALTRGRDLL